MTVKPAKVYPFTIGAYEALPLMVQGSYFKILSATGMVDVTGDTFGTVEAMLGGQGLRGQEFRRLVVRDRSGLANMVRLLVADDQFIDDRITGEVSVLDGSQARSVAGGAFMTSANLNAVGGGIKRQWALGNQSGSGRRVVVTSLVVSSSEQGVLYVATGTGVPQGAVSASGVTPKSVGSSFVSVAASYEAAEAGFSSGIVGVIGVSAYTPFLMPAPEPFVIEPGKYLSIQTDRDTQGLQVLGQFYEEQIL